MKTVFSLPPNIAIQFLKIMIVNISAAPADLDSLKELISSLNSEENIFKFATHVRYNRYVHKKVVEALGDMDSRTKDFHFRGTFNVFLPFFPPILDVYFHLDEDYVFF